MRRLNGVALGLKTIVGSNELYPDLDQAVESEKVRQNVLFDGRRRAIVKLKSRKEKRYDVEALVALLIEYAFYLALKTPNDTYESLSSMVQERKQTLSQLILTVRVGGACHVGAELLHGVSHPRSANGAGLQEPGRGDFPARERVDGAGLRFLPQPAPRVRQREHDGAVHRGGRRRDDADAGAVRSRSLERGFSPRTRRSCWRRRACWLAAATSRTRSRGRLRGSSRRKTRRWRRRRSGLRRWRSSC